MLRIDPRDGRRRGSRSFLGHRPHLQVVAERPSRHALRCPTPGHAVLEEQWQRTSYRGDDDLVFGHPTKGTPLETGMLAKRYLRPALARAGIEKPFRPFHDLRHTSLTHAAAAGNPQIYVQARAGHSQGSITERYMHAAQVLFPGAAAKSEARMFGEPPADDAPRPGS
jgi:integrase